ncbi:MAG: hypothetical protein HRU32_12480 [Rhodobacteraceae bacterium]|nr:hypothetical protein [Paracoccaceae bacterium]
MPDPLVVTRPARAPAPMITVALIWIAGLLATFLIDAALWMIAILLAFTFPAMWDAAKNRVSRLRLDDETLSWSNGVSEAQIPLDRIEHVSLHTGLDFSQRARIKLKTGEKTRIPADCLPPRRQLDAALAARGIPHTRSLFMR